MRRAILWVHEWGGIILGVTLLFGSASFLVGIMTLMIMHPDEHFTWAELTRRAAEGDSVVIGAIMLISGVASAWGAAVDWAKKSPQAVPQQPPVDPILEAAKREVEAIAPEEP